MSGNTETLSTAMTTSSLSEVISKNTRPLGIALGALLVIGGAGAWWQSQGRHQQALAADALFKAHQAVEAGVKGVTPAEARKLDVDTKLAEAVKLYGETSSRFPGTRAAFEAELALGHLYFDRGQTEKSIPWYEKAAAHAPRAFDRAAAQIALAYAYENAAKHDQALASLEKALNQGEGAVKGEVLLAIARNAELKKDSAKARATYDQIITQLPNTEWSRSAEAFRSQL